MTERLSSFHLAHDQMRVESSLSNVASLEQYKQKREALISYNTDQMITNLGERFNVVLSEYNYDIKDGQLWGKDMEEPFVESIKRGRDYRRENGNPIDFRRENAEVIGFEKIQEVMTSRNTPEGTIMLSVSPPGLEGSIYTHNFVDIHTKRINEKGDMYVQSQRLSSDLDIDEYREKLSAFDSNIEIDEADPGASLLENPILIQGLSAADVKFYLYREHDCMDEKSFEYIKNSVSGLVREYAESIVKNPNDIKYHKVLFNAVLNKADELAERIKVDGLETLDKISPLGTRYQLEEEILNYGYSEVREVKAGCGLSGGFELEGKDSPYSVSEYGLTKDKYGERTFKCPSCKKDNFRPYNKLLSRCQHCKSSEVAC